MYPVALRASPGEILPSRVGVLLLEYDVSALKAQALRDALERSLIYSVALAAFCSLLWFFFHKTLNLRVAKLVAASNALARGNLEVRANLQGSDELSEISAAFDQMAEEIQKSTETLRQNEELKQALYKLKQTQAQLIHAEKMSSLGQMVAGVAHEINNPVNFIHGNLNIKDYGKLPEVECYAGQLNQVFMNILNNGIDALLEARGNDKGEIRICTKVKDSDWVAIAIADNGPGMTQEVQQKIFDPFFTTKPVGKGTGLGLSISYQIVVEKHSGKLTCISAPGEGTQFLIEIPVQQRSRVSGDRVNSSHT